MKTNTKRIVMLFLSLIICSGIKAQILYEWGYIKDNGNTDRALIVNPEGGYIHVAGTTVKSGKLYLYTRKYSNDGTWQWSRTGNR